MNNWNINLLAFCFGDNTVNVDDESNDNDDIVLRGDIGVNRLSLWVSDVDDDISPTSDDPLNRWYSRRFSITFFNFTSNSSFNGRSMEIFSGQYLVKYSHNALLAFIVDLNWRVLPWEYNHSPIDNYFKLETGSGSRFRHFSKRDFTEIRDFGSRMIPSRSQLRSLF